MYLGGAGPGAAPRVIELLLHSVLKELRSVKQPTITVSVTNASRTQTISVVCAGFQTEGFPPRRVGHWFEAGLYRVWEIGAVAGASDWFEMDVRSTQGGAILTVQHKDTIQVSIRNCRGRRTPSIRLSFRLIPSLQKIDRDQLYGIAGVLRDISLLRPGVATALQSNLLPRELGYYYADGLKSMLFEDDHHRHPLHPGCLSFSASEADMNVEGYLRFLHAGVPYARSFVNYRPSQGGTHVEGLGDALCELFPAETWGCRKTVLVTNPDTSASISMPHTFIGALHIKLADAKYAGPTTDVLINEDVREFVRKAASKSLKRQWEEFRAKRGY